MKVCAIAGTKGPFPRLIAALEAVARARPETAIWVQHADPNLTLPAPLEGLAFTPHAELLRRIAEADTVIVHGGSGAIRDALKAGHRPLVAPRRARHGEHVNDHQLEVVEALGDRVIPCLDLSDTGALLRALDEGREARGVPAALPGDALRADLRRAITASYPAPRAPLVWGLLETLTAPARRWLRRHDPHGPHDT